MQMRKDVLLQKSLQKNNNQFHYDNKKPDTVFMQHRPTIQLVTTLGWSCGGSSSKAVLLKRTQPHVISHLSS